MRCHVCFEENSVVVTSACNHRYCYRCVAQINLVSGNIHKDLQLDTLFGESINHIKKLSKKNHLNKTVEPLAIKIITELFKRTLTPSKNTLGLACAVIYLAVALLQKEILDRVVVQLPVSDRVIQRNFSALRYILANSKLLEGLDGT